MNWVEDDQTEADAVVVRKLVKSARLQVRPDGSLRVVAPPSFDVDEFLKVNATWIESQRAKFDRLAEEGRGREDQMLLFGRFYSLDVGVQFSIDEASRHMTTPSLPALRRDLSAMLRDEVIGRLKAYPDLTGDGPKRIVVKSQKTRWGSCSSLGNININLRVIALPDDLREYIVVHEAAHLREPNHSDRFWRLVADHFPDYKSAVVELRRYWVILERNSIWCSLRRS